MTVAARVSVSCPLKAAVSRRPSCTGSSASSGTSAGRALPGRESRAAQQEGEQQPEREAELAPLGRQEGEGDAHHEEDGDR